MTALWRSERRRWERIWKWNNGRPVMTSRTTGHYRTSGRRMPRYPRRPKRYEWTLVEP